MAPLGASQGGGGGASSEEREEPRTGMAVTVAEAVNPPRARTGGHR